MSIIDKYFTFWLVAMLSSIALLLAAFVIGLFGGANIEWIVILFILLFDVAYITFLALTILPAGLAILILVITYNLLAPITVPILQWLLDNFGSAFYQIIGLQYSGLLIAPQQASVIETMTAFIGFLDALKDMIITQIPAR